MASRQEDLQCGICGHAGREESDDGFYYCQGCGAQLDIVTCDADDFDNVSRFYRSQPVELNPPPQSFHRLLTQEDNITMKKENEGYLDGIGPTEPVDFGNPRETYVDYYQEVRIRYVMGMQWMIQLQCEALVDKFNVRPLICGVASTLWLRFLAGTGVFEDEWADKLFNSKFQDQRDPNERFDEAKIQLAVTMWFRHLRKEIPLSSSLAISFLACHIAREAILPTDILKWAIEGELPYYAAHIEIKKRFEFLSAPAYRMNPSLMFRPFQTVPVQRLENMAARIAVSLGLHLPPVNFYGIASRYLKKLSVSVERVLPQACRIFEWSMPPDLWLSANELRLPSRVCVMSILIVAIRIVYNINGFGVWEKSLSPSSSQNTNKLGSTLSSGTHGGDENVPGYHLHKKVDNSSRDSFGIPSCDQLDSSDLLNHLEARYNEMGVSCEFTKDLPSYLEYCKDVIYAGAESSRVDCTEEKIIEKLWDFYQNGKDSEMEGMQSRSPFKDPVEKKKNHEQQLESPSPNTSMDSGVKNEENHSISNNENLEEKNEDWDKKQKDKAIRRLKIDMEENRFDYIPPRVQVRRLDYLHYKRKKDEGALRYVAHADYYILLRACARVAEVDIRNMHNGVLSFEKRLAWLEKRIECCLNLTVPRVTCKFCTDNDTMEE